jgi:hypothetical protein
MMKRIVSSKIVFGFLILIFIISCGNNGSLDNNTTIMKEKIVGYLIDAPVVNMGYRCGDKL